MFHDKEKAIKSNSSVLKLRNSIDVSIKMIKISSLSMSINFNADRFCLEKVLRPLYALLKNHFKLYDEDIKFVK